LTPERFRAAGTQLLLGGNTYHMTVAPGLDVVRALGGMHALMRWPGPMLTDSGGFQVFSLLSRGGLGRIDDAGGHFRVEDGGREVHLTPRASLEAQTIIGADIIMAFDECPPADATREAVEACNRRTALWLARSVAAWRAPATAALPGGATSQALYAIVQGGLHRDLREASLADALTHDLPGYALGGLAVGETFADRLRVLDWMAARLPEAKPRYLMGVGTPLDLVEAVLRGIDQFDCVLPTRMGRHGIAYTDRGPLRVKRGEFAGDTAPLDAATASQASRVPRGYLHHLLKSGEILGGQLLSVHNLAYYRQLMARLRAAIRAGRSAEFAARFRAGYVDRAPDEAVAEVAP
jgi:queuine tRNA-ribosyltransferase